MTITSSAAPQRHRRPLKKIILIALVLLLVGGAVLLALAPTIASSIAPGKIESAAAAQIKGSVKVSNVSIGWFSPTAVGPVEVVDPEGKPAARVTVKMPTTLWTIVSGRWWSASKLDLGEVEIAGALDLIRDTATGKTNLERALEPRIAAKPPTQSMPSASGGSSGGAGGGGGLESIKAKLKITSLDATVRDRDAKGVLAPEIGVKGLKGTVDVDYAARPMSIAAKADLSGTPVGGASSAAMTLKLDASVKPKPAGGWDSLAIKLDAANAPIGIIDAVAGQGGALLRALGPSADVRVDAQMTGDKAGATVKLVAPMATADLDLSLAGGVLGLRTAPATPAASAITNHISLKSTEFLASLPALRDALAKAGKQVELGSAGAPALDVTITTLRWPFPPELLAGGNATDILAKQDFRNSGLEMTLRIGAISGRVAIDQPGAATVAPANWKNFAVEPIELAIAGADLSKPVTITGGTKATIDSSPAGDVSVRASASGLLDAAGHLRALGKGASIADGIDADIRVRGMSTALVQPILASANLPIDLKQDVGPTLDLTLQAKANVQGGTDLPPIDFTLGVNSTNIKADATGRYASGIVSLTGNGLAATVNSAAPLAQRILAKPGQTSNLELSGVGAITIEVKEFSAPVEKLKKPDEALAAVKARLGVTISTLGVKPSGLAAEQPVQVTRAALDVRLDGANPPQVDLVASLSHEGAAFDATGSLKLDGITGGILPKAIAGAPQIIAYKPSGKIEIKNAPRSLANLFPAAAMVGTHPDADGTTSPINAALRESIGRSLTLVIDTKPDGPAQGATIKLTTANAGVGTDIAAKLTEKSITIGTFAAFAGMDPKTVNPVLASASKPAAGAPVAAPLQLAQPFKLSLASAEPITVPLKPGSFEPDFASASDAAIKLSTDNDIAINNVSTGADANGAARTTNVRVRSLKADVHAPLAGLAPSLANTKRLTATFSALAARDGVAGAAGATIADVSGNVSASMTGANPDASIKLTSIDCAVVENLLGKPGLLTGALGATAEANLRIQPTGTGAASSTAISATLTAPNVTDAKLDLTMTADRIAITKPSTITWRPDPAFINRMAFAPPAPVAGQPAPSSTIAVTQAAPMTISIAKFAIATSQTADGKQTVGPLKPGVFELDASVTAPSLALSATSQGAAPTPINLDGIKVSVRQQPVTGAAAAPGGEIIADLTIDRVSGGAVPAPTKGVPSPAPAATAKKSTASIHITNLADSRGILTSNAAVLNLDSDLAAFPTPIIDQLAHQKGVLNELLGPTFDLQAQGRNLSTGAPSTPANAAATTAVPANDLKNATGSLKIKATSSRASAEAQGDVKNGLFTQTGPISARITQITPQLITSLAGAVPLVESVEKTPPDEPGAFDGKSLTIPIDGDMSKLSGDATITPGVARFTTKSIFSSIIEAVGGNSGGAIGKHIEPFRVHADHGVLTYEQFKLPVGQFTVETRGTVDLVRRQIDVVTYAPIGALTDKALGQLNSGIAGKLGLFDKLTMVPITTKGPLDNSKTELDLGLFAKEQADKLVKDPAKLIGNVLDLFNKKGGGDPAPAPTPAPAPPAPIAPTPKPKPKPKP